MIHVDIANIDWFVKLIILYDTSKYHNIITLFVEGIQKGEKINAGRYSFMYVFSQVCIYVIFFVENVVFMWFESIVKQKILLNPYYSGKCLNPYLIDFVFFNCEIKESPLILLVCDLVK